MNITLPIKVEIKALGSTGFTRETVERRLADLLGRPTWEPGGRTGYRELDEVEYLRALKKRKGWE